MSNLTQNHFCNYLRLFEMQLYGVLEQMHEPSEVISEKFSDALVHLYQLNTNLDKAEHIEILKESITLLQECISSMQFFDANYQRIEHLADGLSELSDMDVLSVENKSHSNWMQLDDKVQKNYKMLEERKIYQKFFERYRSNVNGFINKEDYI